jgi:hypothetical protein
MENNTEQITQAEVRRWRRLAERYPSKEGSIAITRLLDERQAFRDYINRLRVELTDKKGPITKNSACPFGYYKGQCMSEVPDSYLRWWLSQNKDRSVIEMEVQYHGYPKKAIAIKKLKLWDYLQARFNGDTDANTEELQSNWQD